MCFFSCCNTLPAFFVRHLGRSKIVHFQMTLTVSIAFAGTLKENSCVIILFLDYHCSLNSAKLIKFQWCFSSCTCLIILRMKSCFAISDSQSTVGSKKKELRILLFCFSSQGHHHFSPESVIKRQNQINWVCSYREWYHP